ncbi:hypothetical protein DASC09_034330 [Saccharomycopsis crataegensis]|uniref:Peroxisomal membrane protein PMP47B n=1 Tax=Saccharomycopsis crataegensis TaxID=43959 RepID=A0AAV5QML6_9ASCO|nr:hypothetical protein DASC09_034330 [Saccharomycopsis crataegensis]
MSDSQKAGRIIHAVAGGLGGAAALIVTYPLVAVSCHQQTNKKRLEQDVEELKKEAAAETEGKELEKQPPKKKVVPALELIKTIYQTDGIAGFYAGLESAIYGMALTNFVYYYFYESTGRVVIKNRNIKKISQFSVSNLKNVVLAGLGPFESIITGLIAGSITAVATNPFWVVNTRSTVSKTDKSLLSIFRDVYQKEGIKTFFNGVLPALVLVINPIIQYTIFEQFKNAIVGKNQKRSFKPIYAFFIGALAKLIATGTTYPYITVKSRMHLKNNEKKAKSSDIDDEEQNASMSKLLMNIVRKEGFAGLYNGIFVKLSQSIFTAAFLFFFKEELVNVSVKLFGLIKRLQAKKMIKK